MTEVQKKKTFHIDRSFLDEINGRQEVLKKLCGNYLQKKPKPKGSTKSMFQQLSPVHEESMQYTTMTQTHRNSIDNAIMGSHNQSYEDKLKRISRIITKVNFKSHIPKNSLVKKARMNSDLMIAAKPL